MRGIRGAIIRIGVYVSLIVLSGIIVYNNFSLLNMFLSMIFNFVCLVLAIENSDVIDRIKDKRKRDAKFISCPINDVKQNRA